MAGPGELAPRGDPYLDWVHGSANETESARWRDAALAAPTAEVLSGSPLVWIARVIAALRVLCALVFVAVFVTAPLAGGPILLLALPVVLLGAALLAMLVFGVARQYLFTCGVGWALHRMNNAAPSGAAIAREGLRSMRRLWRHGLGRIGAPIKSLFDAVTVFVIPVMLCEGVDYAASRQRSQELVATRWGPGRFRGHGIPRMAITNVRYAELVEKHGPRGAYRQLWFIPVAAIAAVVGGIVGGSSDIAALAGAGVLLAWAAVFALRSTTTQPLMEGVLRAYLYDYARTGRALPPYRQDLLHDCMREELRGMLGMAQRGPESSPPRRDASLTPAGYIRDAGVRPEDMTNAVGALPDLVRDNRTVMRAVRDLVGVGGRIDATAVTTRAGLAPERTAVVLANLVETKLLVASKSMDGTTTYTPRKAKAAWWEKR